MRTEVSLKDLFQRPASAIAGDAEELAASAL
jgi:hypothetical protein